MDLVKTLNAQIKEYRRILYRIEHGKPLNEEQQNQLYGYLHRHAYRWVDQLLDEVNKVQPDEMSLSALRLANKHRPGYSTMTRKELLNAKGDVHLFFEGRNQYQGSSVLDTRGTTMGNGYL